MAKCTKLMKNREIFLKINLKMVPQSDIYMINNTENISSTWKIIFKRMIIICNLVFQLLEGKPITF